MIGWLKLTEAQRRAVIDDAEQYSGMRADAIEKDWWVTLTLKALFQSQYSQYIVFKGGTSLSKGWNLIARFSEDIDIALDPRAFNMEYKEAPNGSYLRKLKKAGCSFTSNELLNELTLQCNNLGVPAGMVKIHAATVPATLPDTDPQTIFIAYPSLYEKNEYITHVVKIEVSVRSLAAPFTGIDMQSILNIVNPKEIFGEKPFIGRVERKHKR
jgi:predicted nucleotidyltransferase component of viral defense system